MTQKTEFERVKYPKPERKPSGECPECGGPLYHSLVPCPDGKPGCLVAHFGYRCGSCGGIFQKKRES